MQIAILAGGASRRMGRNKLRLPWGEGDLLGHVVACAQATGHPVLILGGEHAPPGCRSLPDAEPGAGPLAALRGALAASQTAVLLLAGDLPLLSSDLLGHIIDRATEPGLAVAAGGRLEPTCSVYGQTCLPIAERLLAAGKRSLTALITAASLPQYDLPARFIPLLHNVNTPDDWAAAQTRQAQDQQQQQQ